VNDYKKGKMSMIVTCESCKTRFHLDPDRLKGAKNKVRCTRCGNVFEIVPPEDEVHIHVDLPDDAEPEDEDLLFPSARPAAPSPVRSKRQGSLRRLAIWILPVVLAGVLLMWLAIQKSSTSSKSPSQEKAASTEAGQPSVTILDTTQAFFLENSHAGGQIFVVEGEVANESNKPISFILLEGKLYTTNNQIAQTQRCYSGNTMNRDELTRLSVTDIQNRMMNREGKNLMNVHIPPAKRIPFMLVFHNLPELSVLGDYSIEVISAKTD
jgi:predicted Zn finger-like uncharacterized protein